MLREVIALPMESRVWIYQSDREFSYDELDDIRPVLYRFVENWESHGVPVTGYANVFHKRFIVIMADETSHGVSGCSTDSSVNIVKELGAQLNADFFNRMLFAYFDEEENIHVLSKDDFSKAYTDGVINDNTLVFDHLVKTKEQFIDRWVLPLKDSWHKRFV